MGKNDPIETFLLGVMGGKKRNSPIEKMFWTAGVGAGGKENKSPVEAILHVGW